MDLSVPSLEMLFEQLGLASDMTEVERFISTHQLKEDVSLLKAPFWNAGQKQFLTEKLFGDDDWVFVVDQLNKELHGDAMAKH